MDKIFNLVILFVLGLLFVIVNFFDLLSAGRFDNPIILSIFAINILIIFFSAKHEAKSDSSKKIQITSWLTYIYIFESIVALIASSVSNDDIYIKLSWLGIGIWILSFAIFKYQLKIQASF